MAYNVHVLQEDLYWDAVHLNRHGLHILVTNFQRSIMQLGAFPHIPITSVIPDPLHLYLRISDQLIRQLILFLRTADNIGKNKNIFDKSVCKNIKRFEDFVQGLGFDWMFYTDKDGVFIYTDFIGHSTKRFRKLFV